MPDDRENSVPVLPDGNRVVIPVSREQSDSGLRVEICGVIHCAYDSHEYDARGLCVYGGADASSRHDSCLSWWPYAPQLDERESDIAAHRYVFRFPRLARGVSPTVRVDVDRFVDRFLIPPSEVRRSLTGRFDVTVARAATPAPAAWRFAAAALPAVVLTGGLAWVIQRRMTVSSLDPDLQSRLDRALRKALAAKDALRPEDGRMVPIRSRLKALEEDAGKLARQIQGTRAARTLHSRADLERDIAALERRAASSSPERKEVHSTLEHKRKALACLAEMEQAEALHTSRLDKVEAVLESALAGLQSIDAGPATHPDSETVCRALDGEVAALREATQQARDSVQVLH